MEFLAHENFPARPIFSGGSPVSIVQGLFSDRNRILLPSFAAPEETFMRHPFDGLIIPVDADQTRRDALGALVLSVLGVGGLTAAAGAQVATTLAIGEEGGGNPLTAAVNEQGIQPAGKITTEPFGEEAGRVMSQHVAGLEDGGKPGPTTAAVREEGGGVVTTEAVNEEAASTRALGEEGAVTQRVGEDGRGPAVPVQPQSLALSQKQLDDAWKDLGSTDAGKALQACALLYGHKQAVSFLKQNLKLDVKPVNDKDIAALVAHLDNNLFAVREKAEAELVKMGLGAMPALQQAQPGSQEARMRLQRVIEKLKDSPAHLQAQRGIEVLVALRTAESKAVLQGLAAATPETLLSQLAKSAVARLP
jgi:hypothetical protein